MIVETLTLQMKFAGEPQTCVCMRRRGGCMKTSPPFVQGNVGGDRIDSGGGY